MTFSRLRMGLIAITFALLAASPKLFAQTYQLENAFPQLSFIQPISMASLPHDTRRLCVLERAGKIQLVSDLATEKPSLSMVLDLNAVLTAREPKFLLSTEGELGLIGLAFHPKFSNNGYFYVFYSVMREKKIFQRISRFTVKNPTAATFIADETSELLLIEQADDASNHNGGDLHFGPDGYLYVSLGDEGGQNDQFNNTQIITKDFIAGILRIDVDKKKGNLEPNPHPNPEFYPATAPQPKDAVQRDLGIARYSIPADNPFVSVSNFNGIKLGASAAYVRSEFWATGLRNPWRFSFDSLTGDLWCADVGSATWEEVNIIQRGGNYGWAWREGSAKNGPKNVPGEATDFVPLPPLYEYAHGFNSTQGVSITGGFVYHGSRFPELANQYIFCDYGSGNIWALKRGEGAPQITVLTARPGITALHADPVNGDILFADMAAGRIARLVPAPSVIPPSPLWSRDKLFASGINTYGKPLLQTSQRLELLHKLGLNKYTFTYDQNTAASFVAEVTEAKSHGSEIIACLLQIDLAPESRSELFSTIEKLGIKPQLWVIGSKGDPKSDQELNEIITRQALLLRPFSEEANRLGCQVGLYNNRGWFGSTKNQLAIIKKLKADKVSNVGIVYNFHNSHGQVRSFSGAWGSIKNEVIALNLSGLRIDDKEQEKTILPLSAGDQELGLMRFIQESGWSGPVGIIDHRLDQAQDITLADNMRGLDWLAQEIATPGAGGAQPVFPGDGTIKPIATTLKTAQVVPWESGEKGRELRLQTAPGMQYAQKELRAKVGERISLVFENGDVMPHNWVLVKLNAAQTVGLLANDMISAPDALLRHFVPTSPDILCYTRMVDPQKSTTVHFTAPTQPGSYPYLCTFPGHWAIMRGVLIVE